MKTLSLLCIGGLLALSQMSNALELSVTIKELKPNEGNLYVRVYDAQSVWLSTEKDGPRITEVITLADNKGATEITKTFDLPAGNYAVTATQDVNSNGIMDRNWMRMPTEPTGSTGSDAKRNGPPAFEDCVFELKEKTQKTVRLVQYQ